MPPIRKGDGTPVAPKGISQVRTGDGRILFDGVAIPDKGLVQRNPFDEGSGSAVSDVVGDNDGTIQGANWESSVGSGANHLDFPSSGDRVEWADIPTPAADTGATIAFWCFPRSLDTILSKNNFSDDERIWDFVNSDGNLRFRAYEDPSDTDSAKTALLPFDSSEWQMFTGVIDLDEGEIRAYVNTSESVGDSIATFDDISTNAAMGVRSDDNSNSSDMGGDHLFVYDRPFDSDDVSELYNATKDDYE